MSAHPGNAKKVSFMVLITEGHRGVTGVWSFTGACAATTINIGNKKSVVSVWLYCCSDRNVVQCNSVTSIKFKCRFEVYSLCVKTTSGKTDLY